MQQYGHCKRVLTLDSVLFWKSFISNILLTLKDRMLFDYLRFTNQEVLTVQLKHLQLVLGGVVSSS